MRFAHVLPYHSGNIAGNDYVTSDLVAFREDLRTILRLGLCVIPREARDAADRSAKDPEAVGQIVAKR